MTDSDHVSGKQLFITEGWGLVYCVWFEADMVTWQRLDSGNKPRLKVKREMWCSELGACFSRREANDALDWKAVVMSCKNCCKKYLNFIFVQLKSSNWFACICRGMFQSWNSYFYVSYRIPTLVASQLKRANLSVWVSTKPCFCILTLPLTCQGIRFLCFPMMLIKEWQWKPC